MRTEMIFNPSVIAAHCQREDRLRAAARAQMIAVAQCPKRRQSTYTVKLGQRLIEIGQRLQAMAKQPA